MLSVNLTVLLRVSKSPIHIQFLSFLVRETRKDKQQKPKHSQKLSWRSQCQLVSAALCDKQSALEIHNLLGLYIIIRRV